MNDPGRPPDTALAMRWCLVACIQSDPGLVPLLDTQAPEVGHRCTPPFWLQGCRCLGYSIYPRLSSYTLEVHGVPSSQGDILVLR